MFGRIRFGLSKPVTTARRRLFGASVPCRVQSGITASPTVFSGLKQTVRLASTATPAAGASASTAAGGDDATPAQRAHIQNASQVVSRFGGLTDFVAFGQFREWLTKNGGTFRRAAFARTTHAGGSGGGGDVSWSLIASGDIARGDVIITVPDSMWLPLPSTAAPPAGTNESKDDRALRALLAGVPEAMWPLRLGIVLLREYLRPETAPSFWKPYIDALPRQFVGIPQFFSRTEIDELQYAPVQAQLKLRSRTLIATAKLIASTPAFQSLFFGQTIDANLLGWAAAAVSSRAFTVAPAHFDAGSGSSGGGGVPTRASIPLIDMCDHDSFHASASVSLKTGTRPGTAAGSTAARPAVWLELTATRDLKRGEPITISYSAAAGSGGLTNDDYLMDYGFVVRDNPSDSIEIDHSLSTLETAAQLTPTAMAAAAALSGSGRIEFRFDGWRLAELNARGLNAEKAAYTFRPAAAADAVPEFDPRLLASLRILFADDADRAVGASQTPAWSAPLSAANERAVNETIRSLTSLLLLNFPTTLADDMKRVAAAPTAAALSRNSRLATEYRIEKKRILSANLKAAAAKLPPLPSASAAVVQPTKP